MNEALNALEDEKQGLRLLSASADIHEEKARKLLNIRDRWRIPIVVKRVASGRRLSINDAKIWNEVAKRLQITEDSDVNAVIQAAITAEPKKYVDASTDAPIISTAIVSPRPVFPKQKSVISVKCSMVPAALFSQTGNAAIIKDAATAAASTAPNAPKAHVPQRTAPTKLARQPSAAVFSVESVTSSLSAGFSVVSTSMKKRLGMNRAATTPKMPVVAEKDTTIVSNSNRSASVSTAKLYRSTTAGTGAADAANCDGPSSQGCKPSRKAHPNTKNSKTDSVTTADAPVLSSRLGAGLTTLTDSFRGSFSFKANINAISAVAEEGAATDDISVVGELENDVLLAKATCSELSETTPVLTRHASVDLDAGAGQNCESNELSHTVSSPLKSVAVLVLANGNSVSATQDCRAESRHKQPLVKQVKPSISPKSVAEPKTTESTASSWINWGVQKKPVVPVERTVSIISPRNSYNAKSPENSSRSVHPTAPLSRAAVSYQELLEKRQHQTELGARAESKGSLHKPQSSALKQIWSSILGSEDKKVTPSE